MPEGNGKRKKLPTLPVQDRFDLNRLYRDQTQKYWEEHEAIDDDNIAYQLHELLWNDDGYKYIGRAIDVIVRLRWLRDDFKKWIKNATHRISITGETGDFTLDDVLRNTTRAREWRRMKRAALAAGGKTHYTMPDSEMTPNEFRKRGEEYMQQAGPILRQGKLCMGIYMVCATLGLDLDSKVPPEILGIEPGDSSADEENGG